MSVNHKALWALVGFGALVAIVTNQAVFGVALAVGAAVAIELLTFLGIFGPGQNNGTKSN